ncbi:LuxR C-terminal-related transcriptional regulator [Actinophytocola algeriensis]|uniref:DNA-binding CsgD family transcriptional regulator n=1 Tax=Actinophytocola algeriensis TaxID=1768010 RepID=A0A7W7VDA1_9PSEU|nr:LuxR C-terminal-related transcriptional regulator [Actinophytocola algeriensis]MBB4905879.1 DNA-binding CsgD family transcriptional regulator [Actinophytocola algeriensis]MBE1472436.1 DNA-binding CsgD family transcriptional regulator [Actinophytocola algeriensis]
MTQTLARKTLITDKELAVVRLLADGLRTKQIARRLGITMSAVSMRLARAADILGTTTAIHTVVECVRLGLLESHTHRAARLRREIADRHASTCALLRTPSCDCQGYLG